MVMPHSALRTGQHLKWRGGNYKRKGGRNAPSIGLNFQVHESWDLDNVEPDFFPMPASVVFAEYTGMDKGAPLAPGTVQMWRGDWEEDYEGITRKSEALRHDDGKFKSPYAELSNQGPTIVDRRLFFVETVPHTAMLPAANITNIRPRLGNQDNILYEGQLNLLEGVVSNDHLFDVYLGECIAPYVALDPVKAVLPVHRSTMTMPLNHDDCEDDKHDACSLEISALHSTMQQRWNNAAAIYREAHESQGHQRLVQQTEPPEHPDQPTRVPAWRNRRKRSHQDSLHYARRTNCGNHQRITIPSSTTNYSRRFASRQKKLITCLPSSTATHSLKPRKHL